MPRLRLVNEYTFEDILAAYRDCMKRKRNKHVAFEFDIHFEKRLYEMLLKINSDTYDIGPSRGFVCVWPKVREVWAAQFDTRVLHHLLYRDIAPFYLSRFIYANCACIKGKGTLFAANLLTKYLRSATEDWTRRAWVLQFDIRNFFVSIERARLWDIMAEDMGETSLTSRLMKKVVFNDPTAGAIVKPGTNFDVVPRHKSLWHAPKGYGLPIGDLTSQLCASGVFLDGLDKYVKHVLKCRWYVRYVDDGALVTHDKEEARYWLECIDAWLRTERGLELSRDKSRIHSANGGINFVGSYILPYRTYTRHCTTKSAKDALREFIGDRGCSRAMDSVNAYLGLMRHKNTYNLRKRICQRACLRSFVGCDAEYTKIFNLL